MRSEKCEKRRTSNLSNLMNVLSFVRLLTSFLEVVLGVRLKNYVPLSPSLTVSIAHRTSSPTATYRTWYMYVESSQYHPSHMRTGRQASRIFFRMARRMPACATWIRPSLGLTTDTARNAKMVASDGNDRHHVIIVSHGACGMVNHLCFYRRSPKRELTSQLDTRKEHIIVPHHITFDVVTTTTTKFVFVLSLHLQQWNLSLFLYFCIDTD